MKTILLILTLTFISGCAGKQIICEKMGNVTCPKPLTEIEAGWFYPPVGVLTNQITSCVGTLELNATGRFDGFLCKELP